MSKTLQNASLPQACHTARAGFSAYLDSDMSGVAMNAISAHLESCPPCSQEFSAWRTVQRSLGELGPAHFPARLQSEVLTAIALERDRGAHLSLFGQAWLLWQRALAPMALRVAGGLAVAAFLLGGLGWMYAPLSAVQANDDALAHLVGPHYLYSQVPPQPIETRRDVPIVVEAMVDTKGRVYDYTILEGPRDESVEVRVQQNLLSSVFQPATVFGVPVRGHVVLTYTGVSVRG